MPDTQHTEGQAFGLVVGMPISHISALGFKSYLCSGFQLPAVLTLEASNDDSSSWVPATNMKMQVKFLDPGLGQGSGSAL